MYTYMWECMYTYIYIYIVIHLYIYIYRYITIYRERASLGIILLLLPIVLRLIILLLIILLLIILLLPIILLIILQMQIIKLLTNTQYTQQSREKCFLTHMGGGLLHGRTASSIGGPRSSHSESTSVFLQFLLMF